MPNIFLHNRRIESIFQLLGEHENDICFSIAWALSQCPTFLQAFLDRIISKQCDPISSNIRLQHYEAKGGITDIEIESFGEFFIIIEAKRGWSLPTLAQMQKYAKRQHFIDSTAKTKNLVVLSACSAAYATHYLQIKKIGNYPVIPLSWKEVATLAINSKTLGSNSEKRLLDELLTYLRGLISMQSVDSNWVYVVSLGSSNPEGWNISWIDIVINRHRYFHPIGTNGWPKDPPNYIAFRYFGQLQSIHHIEGYEVVTNLNPHIPEIPDLEIPPHFLYTLGPAFRPSQVVSTGNIYPNGRVWCMLDTLFTSDTIAKARDFSKKRQVSP